MNAVTTIFALALLLPSAARAQSVAGTNDPTSPAQALEQSRDAYEATLLAHPADLQAQAGEVQVAERLALEKRAHHDANGALGDLLRARKLAPQNPRLLYDLGVLEDELGLYRDADATVDALTQVNPDDVKNLYLRARVKMDLGQLAEAEQPMLAYLKAKPEDATAFYGLGRIYQLGQKTDQAKTAFAHSIAIMPRQTESYYQLGQIDVDGGEYAAAIPLFHKTIEGNAQHGGALTGIGICYFRMKQYAQAELWLQQATAAAPNYQPAHYYYGLTLARTGQNDVSERELKLATQLADQQNQKEAQHLQLAPPAQDASPHP